MSDVELRNLMLLLKDVPHGYLYMLQKIVGTNTSVDWTKGVVRPSMENTWPLFLSIHLLVIVIGVAASFSMLKDVILLRLYTNSTAIYLLNLLINNLLVLVVQLPVNFVMMLYENWVFGKAMCYIGAITPYLLVHCAMLTFILMSVDRYRSIAHPSKEQINVFVCLVTIWISSICVSAPVVAYMHYRDLGHLDKKLRNNGLCWSTADEYSKVIFVTIFTLPSVAIALILVKTTAELKTKRELCKLHTRQTEECRQKHVSTIIASDADSSTGEDLEENYKEREWVEGEMKTQRYLTMMIGLWIICWLPIKIFKTVNTNTMETKDNVFMFDVAPMVLLPISALSTITTPLCFKLMHRKVVPKCRECEHESHELPQEFDSRSMNSNDKIAEQFWKQYT
ncbi:neuromedin-B receptor-like [Watersipora subatra]|uniref:neuromedin-B receptor-like n=1 Tax=Watersipora subatra TaxID=2589382 RepID=UPI00355C935C